MRADIFGGGAEFMGVVCTSARNGYPATRFNTQSVGCGKMPVNLLGNCLIVRH